MFSSENLLEIIELIQTKKSPVQSVLISIDGVGGSGKSTLARQLVEAIGAVCLSVDEYLNEGQGTYVPNLRLKDLKLDLEKSQSDQAQIIIIEGLHILHVLQKLDLASDIRIYLRRMTGSGEWDDQYWCNEDADLEAIFAQYDHFDKVRQTPGNCDSDRERTEYHVRFKPITSADIVLERTIG